MIYIILPVYNEEKNIIGVLRAIKNSLKNYKYHIVLVNDGSTDSTLETVETQKFPNLTILSYVVNGNIGTAFSNGIAFVLKVCKKSDYIIIMESDQTSNPKILTQFLKHLAEHKSDIYIASRYITGGGYVNFPITRYIFSILANYSLRSIFSIPGVSDYTIFFRAYTAEILLYAKQIYSEFGILRSSGFVANAELLVKLSFIGAKISEVPNMYDYGHKIGRSKMSVIRTITEYIYAIIQLRMVKKAITKRVHLNLLPQNKK